MSKAGGQFPGTSNANCCFCFHAKTDRFKKIAGNSVTVQKKKKRNALPGNLNPENFVGLLVGQSATTQPTRHLIKSSRFAENAWL